MIRAGVTHNGDLNRRPFTEITSELKDCASRVPQTIITIIGVNKMQLKLTINKKQYTLLSFTTDNSEDICSIIKALKNKDDEITAYILDHYDENGDGKHSYQVYDSGSK